MSTSTVVVDASVLVDVLLNPQRASRLAAALGEAKPLAPAHVDAEVASALARIHRAGNLTPDQVEQRLRKLAEMTIDRRHISHLLTRAWDLRDNVSMLDALYIALAEEAETKVLTTDARLSRAHPRAILVDWQE